MKLGSIVVLEITGVRSPMRSSRKRAYKVKSLNKMNFQFWVKAKDSRNEPEPVEAGVT